MLEYAHSHCLGDRVSEAETLVKFSCTLSQHSRLDGLAALMPFGASTMLNFEAAHAILAESKESSPVRARLLRAWHHGEALHAGLLELSLAMVLPLPAASTVAALLYGKCPGAECSCHHVVAKWKRTAETSVMAHGCHFAWDNVADTHQHFEECSGVGRVRWTEAPRLKNGAVSQRIEHFSGHSPCDSPLVVVDLAEVAAVGVEQ